MFVAPSSGLYTRFAPGWRSQQSIFAASAVVPTRFEFGHAYPSPAPQPATSSNVDPSRASDNPDHQDTFVNP